MKPKLNKTVIVRIDKTLYQRIEMLAIDSRRELSDLVRLIIKDALDSNYNPNQIRK